MWKASSSSSVWVSLARSGVQIVVAWSLHSLSCASLHLAHLMKVAGQGGQKESGLDEA